MANTPVRQGVNRRKLKAIARTCCDHVATDSLDRAVARGPVSKAAVKRIALRCNDHETTSALDALVY